MGAAAEKNRVAGAIRQLRRRWQQQLRAADDWLEAIGFPLRIADVRTLGRGVVLLARLGFWGKLALILSVGTLISFIVMIPLEADQQQHVLNSPAATLALAIISAFCFATIASSTSILPAGARFFMAAYLVWYLLLAPFLVLPRTLALLPVWVLFIIEMQRQPQWYWVVAWSMLLGRLSWQVISPLELSIALWTAGYFLIGIVLAKAKSLLKTLDSRLLLFASMCNVYGIAWTNNFETLSETVRTGVNALGDFLGIFWIWLAVDLVEDATRAAYHVAQRLERWMLAQRRLFRLGLLLVFVACGTLVLAIGQLTAVRWVEGAVLCSVLLALVGGRTYWRATRFDGDFQDIASDAVVATIVIGLVYGAGAALWESSQTTHSLSAWQVLFAAAPLVVEELKITAGGLQRSALQLTIAAVGVLGLAATVVQFATRSFAPVEATITAPLVGLVLIGIPYLAARILLGWEVKLEPARLFLAGYSAAYPAVLIGPEIGSGSPAVAVILWAIVLGWSQWQVPTTILERFAGLALVAGGTLAFYFVPLVIPIPFLPWTGEILERLNAAQAPALLSVAQMTIWIAMLTAAGVTSRWYRSPLAWLVAATIVAITCRLVS